MASKRGSVGLLCARSYTSDLISELDRWQIERSLYWLAVQTQILTDFHVGLYVGNMVMNVSF